MALKIIMFIVKKQIILFTRSWTTNCCSYSSYLRADAMGLSAGNYQFKIVPIVEERTERFVQLKVISFPCVLMMKWLCAFQIHGRCWCLR